MKSKIFSSAIANRSKVRFLYFLSEVILDPYYITIEKSGKKVIYGKILESSTIKKFELGRIANIKVLNNKKFTPVIPIISIN